MGLERVWGRRGDQCEAFLERAPARREHKPPALKGHVDCDASVSASFLGLRVSKVDGVKMVLLHALLARLHLDDGLGRRLVLFAEHLYDFIVRWFRDGSELPLSCCL